jgi:hypothetical protein
MAIYQQKKSSPYVYYVLCRICRRVNVPDPPGICGCCAKKTATVRDNYRPRPDADRKTKKQANKCGALPWKYRGKSEDHEMCRLEYKGYFVAVYRQEDRKFSYVAGNKKETVLRKNITELTFARTRGVRHLAKILGTTFEELCEKIKQESGK